MSILRPPIPGPGVDFQCYMYDKGGVKRFVTGTDFRLASQDSGGGIDAATHKTLRQLIHLADGDGPREGFASGAFMEVLPTANAFPTSAVWWTSAAKTHKIVEQLVTYNPNMTKATEQWKVYATDGVTVLATTTDIFSYSGVFVTSVTRVIS